VIESIDVCSVPWTNVRLLLSAPFRFHAKYMIETGPKVNEI
jgi:hypothetical protein